MIDNHPEWQKMHNLILRECDVLLKGPDLERKMQGVSMLKVSREMWKHAFYLSYAYRMTGDKRYARKVERDMLTVCRFSNWNPEHCLDGAEMTRGVAFVTTGSTTSSQRVHAVPGAVRILLPRAETVYICSIDTLRIQTLLLRTREHVRPLTPGVYVVVIGKQPYKILIRDR